MKLDKINNKKSTRSENMSSAVIVENRALYKLVRPKGEHGNGALAGMLLVAIAIGLLGSLFAIWLGASLIKVLLVYSLVGSIAMLCFSFLRFALPEKEEELNIEKIPYFIPRWTQRKANIFKSSSSTKRVFCVGHSVVGETPHVADILAANGFDCDICNDLETVLASIIEAPALWSSLLIDMDQTSKNLDLVEIIDHIQEFRSAIPMIPIIVLSSAFGKNDYGLDRRIIADVSLRVPVSERDLIEGLLIASQHNKAV